MSMCTAALRTMCCWDPYQVGFLSFPIVIALHFPLHSFNYLAFSPSLPFSFPFPLFLLFSSFPFLSFLLPHSSYLILSYPILSCPILINPLFTFPPIISAPAPLDSAVCVCFAVWSHACRALWKQISISVNSCGGLLILCAWVCVCDWGLAACFSHTPPVPSFSLRFHQMSFALMAGQRQPATVMLFRLNLSELFVI